MFKASNPKYRIIDKCQGQWLTWNVARTKEEALRIVISCCKYCPGRAVKLVEIEEP